MITLSRFLLAISLAVGLTACGNGSSGSSKACTNKADAPDPSYNANIITTGTDTYIVLSQFVDDGAGGYTVVELQTVQLGYGLTPFFTGNGSVPSAQIGLPDSCYSSSNLDISSAAACWIGPTVDLLTSTLSSIGISNTDQVAVTVQYAMDDYDGDAVDLSAVQGITQGLSTNLESDCFTSSMPTDTGLD